MATNPQAEAPVENSDLPGAVVKAFAPSASPVGAVRLHPLTMAHYLALKRFCPGILGGAAPDDMMLLRALLVLSSPAKDVLDQLAALAPDDFDGRVLAFAATLPLASMQQLADAIGAHVAAAFGTALPAAGERTQKKTASGGGSRRSSSAAASSTGRSATR